MASNIVNCLLNDDGILAVRIGFELLEALKAQDAETPEGEFDNSTLTLCEIYMRSRVNCDKVEEILHRRQSVADAGDGNNHLSELVTIARVGLRHIFNI